MQKTSQDKRTPDLADAKEKPQCGENPLINSSYYYIKCSTKRETTKVKIDLPNQSQHNPVKSVVKLNPIKKVKDGQCNSQIVPLKLGQTKSNSAQNSLENYG